MHTISGILVCSLVEFSNSLVIGDDVPDKFVRNGDKNLMNRMKRLTSCRRRARRGKERSETSSMML